MSEPPDHSILQQKVTHLKGVGPKMAERLNKLKLYTLNDLLFHLPSRYQDRTRIYPISHLRAGQEVLIEGEVQQTEVFNSRRRMMVCQVSDGTATINLRFFYFSAAQQRGLRQGAAIRCFGEIRYSTYGAEIVHPEYQLLGDKPQKLDQTLTPTYPSTEGLQQRTLRRLCQEALSYLDGVADLLPPALIQSYAMPTLSEALYTLHTPNAECSVKEILSGQHPSQQRLAFEELLAHHLSLLKFKVQAKQQKAPAFKLHQNENIDNQIGESNNTQDHTQGNSSKSFFDQLIDRLPFNPTGAQARVIKEIRQDISQPSPMVRLVQGDVGSGKTLVAAAAALDAMEAGYQVALMAPTELLAEQHYQTFKEWLKPMDLEVTWIAGQQTARERRRSVENLLLGISHIAIGTHALFQDSVEFQQLGLIIVDEQHRFGVQQRLRLREKGYQGGQYPHQLIMTATPIPRTLAMTAYADLDYSIIDELPPGRQAIKTVALSNTRRSEVVERVKLACQQGQQVYWVCTLIEESEVLESQAAEETWKLLQEHLQGLKVGLVHGRMASDEKESVMHAFKQGDLHLLVATTVIEVGVDVPNATLMIIENAERLGLAQLHQLRGRVGRGTKASSCVLLFQAPLSKTSRKRLDALRKTTDGFKIAQIDLSLRGAGEVLGTKQTGEMQLKVADLARDQAVLPQVQYVAEQIITHYPDLIEPLINRWMPETEAYASV
jgi:ATP-dependent DNA helicase RecG